MLEGEINQINLIDRFVELWREQFTGAIRFENDGIIKIVYCKGGDILSASTNDRGDSIDEILMRAGKVSREHVKQALAKRKENETLGDALLNLGFITRKELSWARRVQVVGVIRSIAAWSTGTFTIVADYLPKRDEGTLFPLPQIIVELIVTDADRQKFERVMEGGAATFAKAADFDDVFRRLGLNEEAEQIAREIDGAKSANDVAAATGKDSFNVYKLLHALATLGILTRAGEAAGAGSEETPQFAMEDFAAAGVADASDMWAPEPEAAPAVQPMFDFDEAEAIKAPTLEVPLAGLEEPALAYDPTPAAAPARSAWDEDDEPVTETAAWSEPPAEEPSADMPAWDEAPLERPEVNIPVPPIKTPGEVAMEQWGFDEAQLEAARRASVPVGGVAAAVPPAREPMLRKPQRKESSRLGLIIALMAVFIVAAAAYYGWIFWRGKQDGEQTAAAAAVPVKRPRIQPRPVAPAPVPVAPPVVTASTATETTAPLTITSAPIPKPTPAATATLAPEAPLPKVTAKTPAPATPAPANASSYDAKAREFLAAGGGNFTVQIQILCQASNLDKAVRDGGSNVWWVPQTIGTRSCYRVFWGHYATRAEAQQGMAAIPASLRDPAMGIKAVPKG